LQGNTLKKIFALGLIFISTAANAVTYNIAVLESLSGSGDSQALALNDNGMVVGQSYNTSTAQLESVIWNDGVIQSLGISGIARGVNNSGVVVGETGSGSLGMPDGYAYSWSSTGGVTNLGTLGGSYSGAYDINESGVITGHSWIAGAALASTHGFVYKDGVMTDLGTVSNPLGYSRGQGINDAGEIVGRGSVDLFFSSNKYSIYWEGDGTLNQFAGPGSYSTAEQINNNGLIVGSARTATDGNIQFAASWDTDGNINFLDSLGGNGSQARSVNDAGVIVGYSQNGSGSATNRAFVSYDGTSVYDLNELVDLDGTDLVALTVAQDVNEAGQIVGIGVTATGEQRAFLLTAVPVPAAVWLFGSALGILGWVRRSRTTSRT
jgi:probable HAF family extracellular repeat protein